MTTKQKLIAAAFAVSVVALFTGGAVVFPEWATFVLQMIGAA